MRRMLLSVSLVFAFAGMCGGGEEPKNDDPVVVPVNDDKNGDDDEGNWCCEYKDDDGAKQYALTDGPAECNTKYADNDGRWVDGNQCIPCCCKAPNDPEDAEKGYTHELTTPKSCVSGSGECLAADADECADDEKAAPKPKPKPKPSERITPNPRPRTVTPKR